MEIVGILLLIAALVVGGYLIKWLFLGAVILFAWAGESGFVGVAAYFACWVFLFPVMLVGSIIIGMLSA
jgi:hypothetical protein